MVFLPLFQPRVVALWVVGSVSLPSAYVWYATRHPPPATCQSGREGRGGASQSPPWREEETLPFPGKGGSLPPLGGEAGESVACGALDQVFEHCRWARGRFLSPLPTWSPSVWSLSCGLSHAVSPVSSLPSHFQWSLKLVF